MAKNKSTKVLTKKHLARQDRERRQTRIILTVAICVVALVFLAPLAYGLYNYFSPNFLNAITVNGESRTMHEFQIRVKVARQNLISQYMQYSQLAQMFGLDPSTDPQMSQSLNQITTELDTPSVLGGQVIDEMTNDLLIRQYAKANGITISPADIEKAAQEALRYFQNGTPTPTLTPTELVYSTLDAKQLALMTPTMSPTPTQTQTPAPTSTLPPTPTPDLTSTATPIPTFTPTATPYTLQGYQDQYQKTYKTYSTIGLDPTQFRNIFFETVLYHDRVQAKVTANVGHQQEKVWIRDILVTDEATAKNIRSQFLAGGDFGVLASKNSIDSGSKDNGGDLGWFGRDTTTIPVEIVNAAFPMKIGELSQPIKTIAGYHVFQVLGHELRPLTDQEYQTAVSSAFDTWLKQQRANSKVVINNGWTKFVPTTPTLAQTQANNAATATSLVATSQAKTVPK
jgi:parvulin-like peptidyl-prolyl isomerase